MKRNFIYACIFIILIGIYTLALWLWKNNVFTWVLKLFGAFGLLQTARGYIYMIFDHDAPKLIENDTKKEFWKVSLYILFNLLCFFAILEVL